MKKIFKLIPAALALVAFASCSSDDLFNQNAASNAVDGKTMTAEIEGYASNTRAAFAENKTDGKLDKRALVWTAGDSYKVYGELSTPDKYTLQNSSAGKANGTFDLMTEDYNENPAFAVFPYDKVDADRANKKLTVKLSDWTYSTAEVKDEGYSEGGFVSNVPMYGKIAANKPKEAKFGYMTGILRVELQKLPKKTTRLIVVTDRPLTGTFTTEFDIDGDYPEILSPVSNDTEKDNTTLINGSPINNYVLAIATEPVSQRTNKTFFIAVPTGNKYGVFDVYAEYNMAGSTETELVAQLGNTYRLGASKSVLNWQRGKVKSLTKEITVTASGNTPEAIAKFLKDEWKTFPEGAEINITVDNGTANPDHDLIWLNDPTKNTFTIPAELKDKVVNIIARDFNTASQALIIQDDDPAPIPSTSLRQINFVVPATSAAPVTIDAPETQVSFQVADPETQTATLGAITATNVSFGDMTTDAAGLVIGDAVTTGNIKITGSLFTEGGSTVGAVTNDGNYETKFKGVAGNITSNKNGAITVEGVLAADGSIPVTNTVGIIRALGSGAVSVKNVVDVKMSDGASSNAAAPISIENVEGVSLVSFATNANHKEAISIKKVITNGITKFNYTGKGAVTFDDIVGNSTTVAISNPDNESAFTMDNIKNGATYTSVSYAGKGNVSITGVTTLTTPAYPTITTLTTNTTATPLTAGDVTLKDVIVGTTLTKNSQGALTITGVKGAFGDIANADGAISITGDNLLNAGINSVTQNGTGIITLKDISDGVTTSGGAPTTPSAITTLTVKQATTINYENTYIATLNCEKADANYAVTAEGTKSSGIGSVADTGTKAKAATKTFKTDIWDGTSWCKAPTSNIYTSGSFAGLMYHTSVTTADLLVSNGTIDLGSEAFQFIADKTATNPYKGIANSVTKLTGKTYNTNTKKTFKITNLKAATGLFADRTAALTVENVILDNAVITSDNNAGGFVGKATANLTFDHVTVSKATVGGTTFAGSSINIGGFVGTLAGTTPPNATFYNCFTNTATLKGHYYVGGFIGQVENGGTIKFKGAADSKVDEIGCQTSSLTFDIQSKDGVWSTLKCGTVAPFIGGVKKLTNLDIYGEYDSFDRAANMWKQNFLENEAIKFYGTKRDDLNFIGYTSVATGDGIIGTYNLKLRSGFEANPAMQLANTANSLDKTKVLDIEYNAYLVESQW